MSAFASSTDINLGARWLSEIDNALDAADAVLVLCSRWSVARRWINFEAGAGWGQKKPVIPLCHGTMGTEELPDLLQALAQESVLPGAGVIGAPALPLHSLRSATSDRPWMPGVQAHNRQSRQRTKECSNA